MTITKCVGYFLIVFTLTADLTIARSARHLNNERAIPSMVTRYQDYIHNRSKLLLKEDLQALGASINLDANEEIANNFMMQLKFEILDAGVENPGSFNFSQHYFNFKKDMETNNLYKIIKRMPKGAALHVHDMGLLGPDYIVDITYQKYLYICKERDNIQFRFSKTTPKLLCLTKWELVADVRKKIGAEIFDAELRKHFTLVTENPDKIDENVNPVWNRFEKIFTTIIPILTYLPVWTSYYMDALKEFLADGITYVEIRSLLPPLYDLNGTQYNKFVTARSYYTATKTFMKMNPEFIGARLIYTSNRMINNEKLLDDIVIARQLKVDMPDFFAGFDLVGQEDKGRSLLGFAPILLEADLPYFFHAGETNWYGATDDNLLDAILLGAKRIGHGYALTKHPQVVRSIIENQIGLEVNVLSNQVLHLVRDLRNHPLATFLAEGLPVVISSDDPGLWEAAPLSHDFYVAWLGVASRRADIRLLKQLAINSILYSSMNNKQKTQALQTFNTDWKIFIQDCQNLYRVTKRNAK